MTFKTFVEQTFSGLAKGKSLEDLAKKHNVSVEHLSSQLKKGIEVEHEHTKDSIVAKKIAMDHLFEDPNYYTKLKKIEEGMLSLDTIQAALDVAGIEPTYGTAADAANTVISGLRAALSKEPDVRKKHIINAGISAISMIPFADVIKLLKLRKAKPVAKLAVQGARALKTYGKGQQATGKRFDSVTEKNIHDPVRPGILKRQIKGKVTCSKARALKARTKDKGSNTAKAAQRFQNYHCQ